MHENASSSKSTAFHVIYNIHLPNVLAFLGMIDSMASKSQSEAQHALPARTALFQQKDGKTYRIPALIYISDGQTCLAFAEERSTPRDSDAKVLVMRRGSLQNGSLQVISFFPMYCVLLFISISVVYKIHYSLKVCGQYYFFKKLILLFSKDPLNCTKVTTKTFLFQIIVVLLNFLFLTEIYLFPQKH